MVANLCRASKCTEVAAAKGLCKRHYNSWRNTTARRDKGKKPCVCGCGGMTAHGYLWGHDKKEKQQ